MISTATAGNVNPVPPPNSSAQLPDINAETNPFGLVVRLLDEAAFFNLFSTPSEDRAGGAITNAGQVTGVRIAECLHRLDVSTLRPDARRGVRACNSFGEEVGQFDSQWMLVPDDFVAVPGLELPVTPLNPLRSQRFVMIHGRCSFDGGENGFSGFGTGVTYPTLVNGKYELLAAAVGNIMDGYGRFSGLEGTYTYCGAIDFHRGFRGNLLCRVIDPSSELRTEGSLPQYRVRKDTGAGTTFLTIRGEKASRHEKTAYNFGPKGDVIGLNVSQVLRLVALDCGNTRHGGLKSQVTVGPVIGRMSSKILFNLLNPGAPGNAAAPIPFRADNVYMFVDRNGQTIGSFSATGGEGRTFNLELRGAPGQSALRFGGFGVISRGSGVFEGVEGLMTDNSVVGIAPHALSTLYTFRLNDPNGRYSAAICDYAL